MNERIKELVKQAADYANTYSDAGADVWFEIYNKKFAELIVRECASVALMSNGNNLYVCELIKEHFGVGE
jgi:hypothetical protein